MYTIQTVSAIKSMMDFDRYFHRRNIERDEKMFNDNGVNDAYVGSKQYDKDTDLLVRLAKYAVMHCEEAGLDPEEMVFSCVNFINCHGDE
jgi:hypothetical protein